MENPTPQPKCVKMKIFQVIQKNFAMAGFQRKLATQSYPLNGEIFMGFLILGSGLTSILMYIFTEAQTLPEYTQSIYICSIATLLFIDLFIILLNVGKTFNLIDCCEDLANTSKCEWKTRPIWISFKFH